MDFSKFTPEQFKIAELIVEAAEANKIDPNLLLAQAFQESGFKHIPNKETDAFGVMQIRPGTAEQNKLGDITDLRTNIFGGAKLMRQYLDKYKTPEAALLAYHQGPGVADTYIKSGGDLSLVGPNGLDYVIKVGEYGGFGQPVTAEGEVPKKSVFEGYESEAAKFKKEPPEKKVEPPAEPDEEARMLGAAAGAGANLLLPMLTDPQVSPVVDTGRAREANISAQDKLELARRNLDVAAPQGAENLEETFRQSQGQLEQLKNEQRLAQERLRALPRTAPAMEMPTPPASIEAPARTVAGEPGAVNWIRSMAEGVPDVVANQALNMRADNPRGGQAIIDADMAARQRQAALGLGEYGLARTAGGVQLALPPTTVAERQADEARQAQQSEAELQARTQEAQARQAMQAQQLEQQRLSHEADLERLREQRAQLGQRHNVITGQTRAVAPLQRALTKAESDAELAQRRLSRAQEQPTAAGRGLERTGVGSTKMGALPRTIAGGAAGYLGVMSYQDALERFNAGDTSEGVLKALEAGAAGAAMLPPAGKRLTKLRGAGTIGGLGLLGYEGARRLLKDRPPEQ